MKKYIVSLLVVVGVTALVGCSAENTNEALKDTAKEVQVEVIETVTSPEEAAEDAVQEVATNFAKEFFTTQGKAADNLVGGVEYFHPEMREQIAIWMIDSVFPYMSEQEKNLVVSDVVVNGLTKKDGVTINGVAVESYSMEVIVSYQDNKTSTWNYIPELSISKINNTWQITNIQSPEGENWYKDPTAVEQK